MSSIYVHDWAVSSPTTTKLPSPSKLKIVILTSAIPSGCLPTELHHALDRAPRRRRGKQNSPVAPLGLQPAHEDARRDGHAFVTTSQQHRYPPTRHLAPVTIFTLALAPVQDLLQIDVRLQPGVQGPKQKQTVHVQACIRGLEDGCLPVETAQQVRKELRRATLGLGAAVLWRLGLLLLRAGAGADASLQYQGLRETPS